MGSDSTHSSMTLGGISRKRGTQYGEIERFMAEGEFEMGADRVVGPIARRQDAPSLFTAERVFFTDCHQFVRGGTFRLQETTNAE